MILSDKSWFIIHLQKPNSFRFLSPKRIFNMEISSFSEPFCIFAVQNLYNRLKYRKAQAAETDSLKTNNEQK